jgi:hypothetical protein
MTPLYHRLVKRLTLQERQREPLHDPHGLLADLSNVHCFDCTAAVDLIEELSAKDWDARKLTGKTAFSRELFFPPAPRTWVEFAFGGAPMAWLSEGGRSLSFVIPTRDDDAIQACRVVDEGAFVDSDLWHAIGDFIREHNPGTVQPARSFTVTFLTAVAIINSPNVVARTEHHAHKAVARAITKQQGAFKIHPWHKIKLEICKPRDIDDGEPHEDRITGRRALHFCRAFLRIRLGKLEHVRSHWRGDAALGVRRASYKVVA